MPTTVPSIQRAAAILDALSGSPQGLSLSEVCERLKIPKSTAHNLCWTLVQVGQASRDARGSFRIGTAALRYAQAYGLQTDLVRDFCATLNTDTDLPEAHWLLSVLQGDQVLYLSSKQTGDPSGEPFQPGMQLPALYAAAGKAMLATLPAEAIRRLHAGRLHARLTRHSVESVESFLEQRESIRERGYSIAASEVREGMLYYAAPVFEGHDIAANAAVSVSLPSDRPGIATQRRTGAALLRVASALSRRLGANGAGLDAKAGSTDRGRSDTDPVRTRVAARVRP
jgi:DNA-binding IclR family transcriptional regulator